MLNLTPPVYVKCMINIVKGTVLPILFVSIQDMLYIYNAPLYCRTYDDKVYLQYNQYTVVKKH